MNYNAIISIFLFSDSFRASSVRNRPASLPLPQYGENTRGLNEGAMLELNNSLVVMTLFLVLIAPVKPCQVSGLGGSQRKG